MVSVSKVSLFSYLEIIYPTLIFFFIPLLHHTVEFKIDLFANVVDDNVRHAFSKYFLFLFPSYICVCVYISSSNEKISLKKKMKHHLV